MLALARLCCVTFMFLGCEGVAQAQAVKVVEKLASRAASSGVKLVPKGTVIVLHESGEAAKMIAKKAAPMADDVLTTRFSRLSGVDDTLRAEFRALAPSEKRLAVELGEGVQVALRRYPEDGLKLIQTLDAGGLAQARTYGDFVLDGAHWLQTDDVARALGATKLKSKEASALAKSLGLKTLPETLQLEHVTPLWKTVIRKTGEGSGVFWREYILPHKGKWLVGGLLTTYLIMPETFHDAAGNLTEHAVRQLSELGIAVSSGAARGISWDPIKSIHSRYAAEPVTTIFVSIFIISLLLLAIPSIRRTILNLVRCSLQSPSPAMDNKRLGSYTQEPFRE